MHTQPEPLRSRNPGAFTYPTISPVENPSPSPAARRRRRRSPSSSLPPPGRLSIRPPTAPSACFLCPTSRPAPHPPSAPTPARGRSRRPQERVAADRAGGARGGRVQEPEGRWWASLPAGLRAGLATTARKRKIFRPSSGEPPPAPPFLTCAGAAAGGRGHPALPRASLVCKRRRGILSDHRSPPLLGFMTRREHAMRHEFVPLPRKKPDRVPPARFAVPKSCALHGRCQFLGYSHGLAGMLNVCVESPDRLAAPRAFSAGDRQLRCCVLMLMSNVVALATFFGDFVLLFESMRFRRISERNGWDKYHPLCLQKFLYTAGRGVGSETLST